MAVCDYKIQCFVRRDALDNVLDNAVGVAKSVTHISEQKKKITHITHRTYQIKLYWERIS